MTKLTPTLRIVQPGLLATLQDRGRWGHLAEGITTGGPADDYAFLWGNKLLDNVANAAQIEITLGGFKAEVLAATQLTVCGAAVTLEINGHKQPNWQVVNVHVGDVVTIAPGSAGVRSYLAVQGGFAATPVFGSVATVVRDGLGGLQQNGTPLQANDIVSVPPHQQQNVLPRRPQIDFLPTQPKNRLLIDVISTGQAVAFSKSALASFYQQTYRVTQAQDRMGMRLQGTEPVVWEHEQILSEPLPIGAIQIPPDGQPIVMLVDRQTLGGYPKIGTVTWRSRCYLAQAMADTEVNFRAISLAQAQTEWRQYQRFFASSG